MISAGEETVSAALCSFTIQAKKKSSHLFSSFPQATGAVFLLAGLWIALKLHKYLELDSDVSSGLPLFFSGLGLFVLVLASAACQCAVKGAAPKLYVVSRAIIFRQRLT